MSDTETPIWIYEFRMYGVFGRKRKPQSFAEQIAQVRKDATQPEFTQADLDALMDKHKLKKGKAKIHRYSAVEKDSCGVKYVVWTISLWEPNPAIVCDVR